MTTIATSNIHRPKTAGHFDLVTNSHACGWAIDLNDPSARVAIEIVAGDIIFGRGGAEEFRKDLTHVAGGDGKHMFKIPISYDLFDNKEHILHARCAITHHRLPGNNRTFGPQAPSNPFGFVKRAVGLELFKIELQTEKNKHLAPKISNFFRAYDYASVLQECGHSTEALEAWGAISKALQSSAVCDWKTAENFMLQGKIRSAHNAYIRAIECNSSLTPAINGLKIARCLLGYDSEFAA
jgi:hypothetical protein